MSEFGTTYLRRDLTWIGGVARAGQDSRTDECRIDVRRLSGRMTRRRFLSAAGALARRRHLPPARPQRPRHALRRRAAAARHRAARQLATMYGPMVDDGFSCRPSPIRRSIRSSCARSCRPDRRAARERSSSTRRRHHLYLVREGGMAIRYGVGLGRAGFEWSGDAVIQWKQHWPKWTPPDEMVARDPKLEPYSAANGGMPGGLDKSARRARALSVPERPGHALPPARLAGMEVDRQVGVVRLRAPDQPGHHRSLRPRAQPDAGDRHLRRRRRLFRRLRHRRQLLLGPLPASGRSEALPPVPSVRCG